MENNNTQSEDSEDPKTIVSDVNVDGPNTTTNATSNNTTAGESGSEGGGGGGGGMSNKMINKDKDEDNVDNIDKNSECNMNENKVETKQISVENPNEIQSISSNNNNKNNKNENPELIVDQDIDTPKSSPNRIHDDSAISTAYNNDTDDDYNDTTDDPNVMKEVIVEIKEDEENSSSHSGRVRVGICAMDKKARSKPMVRNMTYLPLP